MLLCAAMLFTVGCGTVPSIRVSRPWTRSLKSNDSIDTTKAIKVYVSESTSPLLGSEDLVSQKLCFFLTDLLTRRGFTINNNTYDYSVKLSYRTIRNDKMSFSSGSSSANYQTSTVYMGTGVGATSGLGVSMAQAVGMSASFSSANNILTANQILSYIHTLSIELSNKENTVIWEGESTWDSQELNLLHGIIPAMQLLLSDLPSDETVRPEIQEVKETHVKNYYILECKDYWFTCPALPYPILFDHRKSDSSSPESISVPKSVKNRKAFAAYVDLIQTAEYALPDGGESKWKEPLDTYLWKKVTLGGQYLLGPQKTPTSILIKLTGETDGYYISECKIATENEFSKFNKKLKKWREMLSDYYNVYQK